MVQSIHAECRLSPWAVYFLANVALVESRLWNSLPGSTISTLTTSATYPNQPSSSSWLTKLETSSAGQDQYGQLLVGTLYPPKTGSYRFYIAADDAAELWLSNSGALTGRATHRAGLDGNWLARLVSHTSSTIRLDHAGGGTGLLDRSHSQREYR